MKRSLTYYVHFIILIGLFFFTTEGELFADEVKIAFPQNLPPWTIQDTDQGITLDIVREALKVKGHMVKAIYLSLGRLNYKTVMNDLDGHAQVESHALAGHYSEKIMEFQTCLISLKKKGFKINAIEDLKNKTIIAFQNASSLFTTDFEALVKNSPLYKEMIDQERQVALLFLERHDIILIDKNIFLFFRKRNRLTDTSAPVVFHSIQGLTITKPCFAVFKEKNHRDDFNTGLATIRESGKYERIVSKYLK